jgi:hypothetical protein
VFFHSSDIYIKLKKSSKKLVNTCLEPVWLRVSVCISSKTHEMAVWLQIVKQSKHMGPTIYIWQDHDFLKAVKYCFFTSFNLWNTHCSRVNCTVHINNFFFLLVCYFFNSHCSHEHRTVISILYLIIFYLILLHAHKIIKTIVLIGWILYVMKL